MAVFPAPVYTAAAAASRSVFAAAEQRTGESHQPRPQSVLLDTCLHHLQLLPHQIEDKLRGELLDGLEKAKDQMGNSTVVFNEWELLQNTVRALGSS